MLDSVEAINITNIANNDWLNIGTLSCDLRYFGVTALNDLIFIVGGTCTDGSNYYDQTHYIDTTNNIVGVYSDSLSLGVLGMPIIAFDSIIYGYGGNSARSLDTWWSLDMLSVLFSNWLTPHIEPQHCDTFRPTESPTLSPISELSDITNSIYSLIFLSIL